MSCESCSHSCGGCSGQSHCGGCGGCASTSSLNEEERGLLLELAQTPFLPLVQFARRESYFAPLEPLEPSPVYLHSGEEETAEIELRSLALRRLASRGYITLDYDIPLSGYDYVLYQTSALCRRLAKLHPGYTIVPKRGSMALTAAGQDAADDPTL
jgi:hypothetical protein